MASLNCLLVFDMYEFLKKAVVGVMIYVCMSTSMAEEISRDRIKGIDEQIQDIKKDILAISAELKQLDEKLIYPSSTQISLFVALAKADKFRLDAIHIKIDGKDATHFIYSTKELEALQSGGVQRLYTGNIRPGEHTLEVSLIGKTAGKNDYLQNASFKFTKTLEPKLVEITLAGPDAGNPHIGFKD